MAADGHLDSALAGNARAAARAWNSLRRATGGSGGELVVVSRVDNGGPSLYGPFRGDNLKCRCITQGF
jgi:hypothetical protein